MINTYYYNPQNEEGSNNFGDMLVPIIVKWISGKEVKYVPQRTTKKLLVIGSEMANPRTLQEDDIVWGYGANRNKIIRPPKNVQFLAVRGKKTRNLIEADVPEIYCDPALLMSKIYQPKVIKKYKIGIVPHYVDKEFFKNIIDPSILIINVQDNVYKIINEINSCEIIISTSMHGCIVAESYGLPTVWLKVGNKIDGLEFKWNDYLTSTGRDEQYPHTDFNINKIIDRPLPQPIINTDPLIKAWRDYFG